MTGHISLEQRHAAELNRLLLSIRLGSFRCDFLYWGTIQGAWRNYAHNHSFVEVCYAFAGEGTFTVHDEQHRVEAGDLFVARPGDVHDIVSSTDGALGICFWAYSVERLPHQNGDSAGLDRLFTAFLDSPLTCRRPVAPIAAMLELLADELDRRAPAYRYAVESLVGKLLIDSCRTFSDLPSEFAPFEVPEGASADLQVRTIARYLEDNYRRPITVRDVAAQLHLSDRHTRRLFRNVMGISLMEYLTRQRLQIAAHMLLTDDVPIKEVAARCGYPDVQYFTSIFRRNMGQPPGRFREQGGTHTLGDKPRGAAKIVE